MTRSYNRKGGPRPAPIPPSPTGVEPVATAALNEEISIMPPATQAAIDANKDLLSGQGARMIAVKLLRNYRPIGEFEVVGYEREAILKKNAAGMMETVQEAAFIDEELPPPAQSGTGFPDKLWAGAVIRLPIDEAKSTRKAGIAEYELND